MRMHSARNTSGRCRHNWWERCTRPPGSSTRCSSRWSRGSDRTLPCSTHPTDTHNLNSTRLPRCNSTEPRRNTSSARMSDPMRTRCRCSRHRPGCHSRPTRHRRPASPRPCASCRQLHQRAFPRCRRRPSRPAQGCSCRGSPGCRRRTRSTGTQLRTPSPNDPCTRTPTSLFIQKRLT